MNLNPTLTFSHEENNDYSSYDNRPIRPMDQDALNEALARLPILVDENQPIEPVDQPLSAKSRRQPALAYSTRRKMAASAPIQVNQSILNVQTPSNVKRKIPVGNTPIAVPSTNKLIKQIDVQRELNQLKEDKLFLEEMKNNLEFECSLLKKTHEEQLELIREEHRGDIERLNIVHQKEIDQMKTSLGSFQKQLDENNAQMANLREENVSLSKIVAEFKLLEEKFDENETTIKNLRDELSQMKSSTKGRTPLKVPKENVFVGERPRKVVIEAKAKVAGPTKPLPSKGKVIANSSSEKGPRLLRPKFVV